MPKHDWAYDDDIVAYYLCRFDFDDLLVDLNGISRKLGMKTGSMKMRISNFKALEGRGRLVNAAALSREVYTRFKNITKSEHLGEVQRILY